MEEQRKALEKLILDTNNSIYKNELTQEKVAERLKKFADEKGNVSYTELISFAMQETRDYTTAFVSDVIMNLFDQGYLAAPKKENKTK